MRKPNDVTAAESIKSNLTVPFFCSEYIACAKQTCDDDCNQTLHRRLQIDDRDPYNTKVRLNDNSVAYKYGCRGMDARVHYLSPFEFSSEWEVMSTALPVNRTDHMRHSHATLTASGVEKAQAKAPLIPGIDYKIRAETGFTNNRERIAFPDSVPELRHDWVMVRHLRPAVPKFEGYALLKGGCTDDHLHHMCIYIRPWVLLQEQSDQHVVLLSNMRSKDSSWTRCWLDWIDGNVLSVRSKTFIHNFQCVFSEREEDPVGTDEAPKFDRIQYDCSVVLTGYSTVQGIAVLDAVQC